MVRATMAFCICLLMLAATCWVLSSVFELARAVELQRHGDAVDDDRPPMMFVIPPRQEDPPA